MSWFTPAAALEWPCMVERLGGRSRDRRFVAVIPRLPERSGGDENGSMTWSFSCGDGRANRTRKLTLKADAVDSRGGCRHHNARWTRHTRGGRVRLGLLFAGRKIAR